METLRRILRSSALVPATLRSREHAGVLAPQRGPRGHRQYLAQDVRDAELAHLLRRGDQLLGTIATVLGELRNAGSLEALAKTLEEWRRDLRCRGMAQPHAAGQFSTYLDALDRSERTGRAPKHEPH
ncbi:hypothetical protein OG352_03910 [Streptomyces sp. NBC_01485]|uniref:hypothetical protein n=1 Tax=Streptomyces sp. NBC_01485 TaxID=2903884 RepID=UPI002E345713|nr:hypothetical protein [Streptomyces sp. NBC_01485]